MERLNQLGKNKLKEGSLYDFEVVSNNLEKDNLISLKLNEEFYTVELLKKQDKQDLPKFLKCEVKSIINGEVVLIQKKKNKVLLFLLFGLLGLVCIGAVAFFYQKDLTGFEEDVDNESKVVEVEKPIIEEETIEFKVNGFGGSTKSIKDMTKNEYQAFLQNKNTSSSDSAPSVYFDLDDFKNSVTKRGEINTVGFKFNQKEALLNENHKAYIKEVVNACNETNKKGVFNISGFTCDLGADRSNMELSKARAISVKEFLDTLDLNENTVEVNYYGESKFEASDDIEQSRSLNRLAIISYIIEE